MKNEKEKYVVFTEKQIVQKMAGYKSAYTKLVKSAKTAKERELLELERQSYLDAIEHTIRTANKKAIKRRAGHLSWITRKSNQEKKLEMTTTETNNEKKSTRSCKKVCRCNVSSKKR